MKKSLLAIAILLACIVSSCGDKKTEVPNLKPISGLKPEAFCQEVDGKQNSIYLMKNANGMEVCVINYGARIVSVMVPDKDGKMKDVVLGFDNIDDFTTQKSDFGAAIGRYGNRIAKGRFTLDDVEYQLPTNNNGNTLHGGPKGFQYTMFDIEQISETQLVCSLLSPDGDMGFPGKMKVKMTYTLTDDNAIDIAYEAITDKATVVNLTNHSYFNLSGDGNNPITDHILYMACDRYTPTDDLLIPTGEIAPVAGTPMDFNKPTAIGARINNYDFEALKFGMGYDHNWIFANPGLEKLACKAVCPSTGISLEVYTDEPAVQFYAGNFLDGTAIGKGGIAYQQRTAFCLETQHYPDSPNHKNFPSTVLRPGETYKSRCIYKFGIEK